MKTREDLKLLQALPLDLKVRMSQTRIREWVQEFGENGVYVSFSGGKDSTVLLDIVRGIYPNIEAVFINTGLEYPEIQSFAKSFPNVRTLTPKMGFKDVITQYGYPFVSKEVSNTLDGARRYIDNLVDRQTDRQTDRQIPYAANYRRVCGLGEYYRKRLRKSPWESPKIGDASRNDDADMGEVHSRGRKV